MARVALVAGSSGGFGGAMAAALRSAGWQVRPYARGTDMGAAAKGADVIVNGLNPPRYHAWDRLIPEITEAVLAAAKASGARVLVPGNVYPFGVQPGPWTADTPHLPVSRKGRIRAKMEARYRDAAAAGQARVLILRAGDFIQAGGRQGIYPEVVLKPLAKGRIVALGRSGGAARPCLLARHGPRRGGASGAGRPGFPGHALCRPLLFHRRPGGRDRAADRPCAAGGAVRLVAVAAAVALLGTGPRAAGDAVSL
jgi:nucleoside-diphosphate-sugar epimerase